MLTYQMFKDFDKLHEELVDNVIEMLCTVGRALAEHEQIDTNKIERVRACLAAVTPEKVAARQSELVATTLRELASIKDYEHDPENHLCSMLHIFWYNMACDTFGLASFDDFENCSRNVLLTVENVAVFYRCMDGDVWQKTSASHKKLDWRLPWFLDRREMQDLWLLKPYADAT